MSSPALDRPLRDLPTIARSHLRTARDWMDRVDMEMAARNWATAIECADLVNQQLARAVMAMRQHRERNDG